MKIKAHDNIKVISGKDSGKTGKVVQVFPEYGRVVVEGVRVMKKHMRTSRQGEKGQILELSAPFDVSNVMMVCPRCGQPARVGYGMDGDKKKRVCRKCKEFID